MTAMSFLSGLGAGVGLTMAAVYIQQVLQMHEIFPRYIPGLKFSFIFSTVFRHFEANTTYLPLFRVRGRFLLTLTKKMLSYVGQDFAQIRPNFLQFCLKLPKF